MPVKLGNKQYYSTDEVAVAINKHINTAKKLLKDGDITSSKVNNAYLVERSELARFLNESQSLPENMIDHRLGITSPRGKNLQPTQ